MIYTLTLSPSLDYHFNVEKVEIGTIMHSHGAMFTPGGKGINVSCCLTKIGIENKALGFVGGVTGQSLKKMLKEEGVKTDFVEISGNTRINVKINSDKGVETAFNLDGPLIEESEITKLHEKLKSLESGDILIVSGSCGRLHRSIYSEIIEECNSKQILCCLDTSGVALKEGLKAHPFLIKPNLDELSDLIGHDLTLDEIPEVGAKLIEEYKLTYVLVSLGSKGAMIVTPSNNIYKKVIKGNKKVMSTVGAGDSMLAAFMAYLSEGRSVEECLDYSIAVSCATCYLGHFPSKEDIEEILN